jgi:Iap family predicted aminopeptidase
MQGPILAFIYAVKEMLEEGQGTDASLPVNVAFVFEGEEENGTPSLPQHFWAHGSIPALLSCLIRSVQSAASAVSCKCIESIAQLMSYMLCLLH